MICKDFGPDRAATRYVTETDRRENLARYMDEAADGRAAMVVTRQGKRAVVMMSLEELEGWQETVHLPSSPRNAEVLLPPIREIVEGKTCERELIRPSGTGPEA